jgi:predicted glycogen debranching enzyme
MNRVRSAPHLVATPDPVRIVAIDADTSVDDLIDREWLVTNGFGGYASGTIAGVATRRHHGVLISALPNPAGRVMMLNHIDERIRIADGSRFELSARGSEAYPPLALVDFRLELGLPVWRFAGRGVTIERRIAMLHLQNSVVLIYRMLEGDPVRIELRPAVHFRGHDVQVSAVSEAYPLQIVGNRIELTAPAPLPGLRLRVHARDSSFVVEPRWSDDIVYPIEESRGYASRGTLYSPGRYRAPLSPGADVALIASTESWDTVLTMSPSEALAAEADRRRGLIATAGPASTTAGGIGAELVLAADQFVIRPIGRRGDHVWARAAGNEACSVIAGYHWFTDWGRDTMISLEGLTLVTGRTHEAGSILRTFAHHLRDGLVPNLFPEGESEGLYHTADATLWFVHAIDRYVRRTGDDAMFNALLPAAVDIIDHHVRGTRFGIGVDPTDGLLRQGAPGLQLTWMDAKVGDWVVTPRRGKAVEINALWYNALRVVESWLERAGDRQGTARIRALAETVRASFNHRFWNPATGHLDDIVDGEAGDDPACRPNQLFAISLPNPVLDRARWTAVLDVVERTLVTPVGLRSLAPGHPDYKPTYHGDLVTRDAAYHQGTVWSWLIGPYIDAWLKVRPDDRPGARRALDGLLAHLDAACIGQVSEVFDAEPPFTPRGCAAQAWGVAELLRCLVNTE